MKYIFRQSSISYVGCKGSQTSFRIRKGQAVNRLEQFLPPMESKQLETFSYSSAWLESASGNGDKRLTK